MQYLAIGCRAALALVFVLAAGGKLIGPGAFAEFTRSVIDMNAVPARFASLAAKATVTAEALTVVLVVIPLRWTGILGCALALGMTAVFTNAIVRSIRRGRQAACRCFGRTSTPLGTRHLVRNAVLMTVAVVGLVSSPLGASVAIAGALVGAVAGLFIGLVVATFDDIAQLLAPA